VADRDAIYEATTSFAKNGKYAQVKLTPHAEYKEVKENFVRVKNGTGYWELEEIAPNTIHVVYQFHADPGGEIPAWIANTVIVINPLKSLESLRDKVKKLQ
jgi:hypothetical protein